MLLKDVRIDTYRMGNRVSIRVTHLPTNTVRMGETEFFGDELNLRERLWREVEEAVEKTNA